MNRFTVFGRSGCGFCHQAQQVLLNNDLPFRYVDIHEEGISQEDLERTVGKPVRTVPQIFYGEAYVGGFQELDAFLRQPENLSAREV